MRDLLPVFDDRSHMMVNVLMDKALDCPKCGAFRRSLVVMSEKVIKRPRYLIACRRCSYQGPFGKHISAAVKNWNKPPGLWARLDKFLNKKQKSQKHIPAHHPSDVSGMSLFNQLNK